jgi:hypothetical protein
MRIFCSVALLLLITTAPTFAVNVRDQGALCNGTNDDTLAFKKAIAAAPVGGRVVVPPGSCVVTDTLLVNSPVSIVGEGLGSQIFQQSDKTLLHFQNTTAVMIKNLFLGSAATTAGNALIKLTNSHRNRIENVTMLGGYHGLYLKGSLLNTVIDLRSGINFSNLFFAASGVSTNQYWVYAEPFNSISANANTFIAPVLEGGTNGMFLTDGPYPGTGQGSVQIVGGTIEGVTGVGLQFHSTFLPSSVSGVDFEDNGQDIIIENSSNIRLSAINSVSGFSNGTQQPHIVSLTGDTRNVQISDSSIDSLNVAKTTKRIVLQNITFGLASGAYSNVALPPVTVILPGSPTDPFPGPITNITADNVGNYAAGQ